jgi:RNA polymerase sigma-70 factor (ECF subfamily)
VTIVPTLPEDAARQEVDFSTLVAAETRRLLALATLVIGNADEAEDAVQEAMIDAWRGWRSLRSADRGAAWLTTICVRRCLRRKRLLARLPMAGWPADLPAPQRADDVNWDAAFRTLSRQQRAVVLLHYRHGYSLDECARAVGCRPGTARTHLSRALKKFREVLDV